MNEEVQSRPSVKHDYLLLLSRERNVRDLAVYYRESNLPTSLAFLQTIEAPRKAAFVITEGVPFEWQIKDLLSKAGLTEGHIELMPLRDFRDYYDQEVLRQLNLIPGFTFSVFDPVEEERQKKEEASKKAAGLTFY